MIITLTFNTDNIEDMHEYDNFYKNAKNMYFMLSDIQQRLRSICKYGEEGYDVDSIDKFRDYFYNKLGEYNLDI